MSFANGEQIGRTVPPLPGIVGDIGEEQRAAARRTVAHYATDTDDAVKLMLMLGLFPGQESEAFQIPDSYRFDWC